MMIALHMYAEPDMDMLPAYLDARSVTAISVHEHVHEEVVGVDSDGGEVTEPIEESRHWLVVLYCITGSSVIPYHSEQAAFTNAEILAKEISMIKNQALQTLGGAARASEAYGSGDIG